MQQLLYPLSYIYNFSGLFIVILYLQNSRKWEIHFMTESCLMHNLVLSLIPNNTKIETKVQAKPLHALHGFLICRDFEEATLLSPILQVLWNLSNGCVLTIEELRANCPLSTWIHTGMQDILRPTQRWTRNFPGLSSLLFSNSEEVCLPSPKLYEFKCWLPDGVSFYRRHTSAPLKSQLCLPSQYFVHLKPRGKRLRQRATMLEGVTFLDYDQKKGAELLFHPGQVYNSQVIHWAVS